MEIGLDFWELLVTYRVLHLIMWPSFNFFTIPCWDDIMYWYLLTHKCEVYQAVFPQEEDDYVPEILLLLPAVPVCCENETLPISCASTVCWVPERRHFTFGPVFQDRQAPELRYGSCQNKQCMFIQLQHVILDSCIKESLKIDIMLWWK